MKIKNIAAAFMLSSVVLSSCVDTNYEAIDMNSLLGDSLVANTTIKQLISTYAKDTDEYTYIKYDAPSINAGLFTCDSIGAAGDVVIKGVVTSTDVEGNVYKYMTVQEYGDNGRAIKISIDASGLSGIYPLGQRVWIRCNGLYIGKYAQSYQLGVLYYNLDKTVNKDVVTSDTTYIDNVMTINYDTTVVTVYRKEPGRIPLPVAKNAIHAFGLPDVSLVRVDTMTIAQIKAAGDSINNKLVCIKNAYFTGMGADYGVAADLTNDELIFAPSTNGVGYPQSREIKDPTGSIFISTSEYAKFADYALPSSDNIGNITAIVGWYNDKKPTVTPASSTTEIYHQLTLRTLSDLGKGFEAYHEQIGY
ncbi:MAG: DUF5689 domain-containing protein [Paludibacter sp.]|nr:DUF5689 domain-containing protein [Paludibacter sp.]